MATTPTLPRDHPASPNYTLVQFKLARRVHEALKAEAQAMNVSPSIAAKLLLTQRLDQEVYDRQVNMLRSPRFRRFNEPRDADDAQ